jgi:hypothetical protein
MHCEGQGSDFMQCLHVKKQGEYFTQKIPIGGVVRLLANMDQGEHKMYAYACLVCKQGFF